MLNVYLVKVATAFLILLAAREVSCLKCWVCSTTAIEGEFCKDPFDIKNFTPEQKDISFKECVPSVTPGIRNVCKKLEQRINDNLIIQRSCYFEDMNDSPEKCSSDPVPPNIRTLFCSTCTEDGCNGAVGINPTRTQILIVPVFLYTLFNILL